MSGLVLFAFVSAGLGFLLPRPAAEGPEAGLRFFSGFVLFLLAFFAVHIGFGLPLVWSAYLLLGAAGLGWLLALARGDLRVRAGRFGALHPVLLLLLIGGFGILINGGIGYLPYTSDEFSNWIGASRHIFLAGDYAAIRDTIHLPGYTPGWRLALLFPWVVTGRIDEGASAAAPFVMMVGLAGMIHDLVSRHLGKAGLFGEATNRVFAWLVLLIGLLAQVAGTIWARDLLIEPPQIYTIAALALILAQWGVEPRPDGRLLFHAGLVLAGSYLIKNAALAVLPGIALMLLIAAWRDRPWRSGTILGLIRASCFVLGPIFATALVWKIVGPETESGIPSILATLQGDLLAQALAADWRDLAGRFLLAVWDYVASYKAPLTAISLAALLWAAFCGRVVPALFWTSYLLVYLASLYWYHLAAFGPFYFAELNSIQRFTRVPLQVLHVLGLVTLVHETLLLLPRAGNWRDRIVAVAGGRPARLGAILMVGLLLGIETLKVARSVEDVSTRRYQNADYRIAETRMAVAILAERAGRDLPAKPGLVLIAQGEDSEPLNYAHYYGRRVGPDGQVGLPFRLAGVSWTDGAPRNAWQQKTNAEDLRALFLDADMIWPMRLDSWVGAILAPLANGESCPVLDERIFLLRLSTDPARPFVCQPKPLP